MTKTNDACVALIKREAEGFSLLTIDATPWLVDAPADYDNLELLNWAVEMAERHHGVKPAELENTAEFATTREAAEWARMYNIR